MRLVCLHADTVEALRRLNIALDDLTPSGLWSSQYHLVGLTPDQIEALEQFKVDVEDLTPAQLAQGGFSRSDTRSEGLATATPHADRVDRSESPRSVPAPGSEPMRGSGTPEAEVPLTQARDAGARSEGQVAPTKAETPSTGDATPQNAGAKTGGAPTSSQSPQKGSGKGAQAGQAAQSGARKGQSPAASGQTGARLGSTRLRISVAGKYTEASVANGKIVVGSRTYDTPDQAAADLTKSRGDWTFWEYYDTADGKWRMLTRDWDTVLKSAAPGGR